MGKLHRYRVLFLAVIGAIAQSALLPAYSQAVNSSDRAPTAEAQKLLDRGQFDDALKLLGTLTTQQPEPPGTERLRGMAFYNKGQMSPAEKAFAKAVAQDPADREAIQMEGVALFRIGRSAADAATSRLPGADGASEIGQMPGFAPYPAALSGFTV
jgi:predicted Zn-dependent protease